ncbi:DENN domain-containing protein 2A isoform X2 [Tenrec ecaudatus]|uniref:DENN domain-containing protein 2A isoform X2 n=1 Tax=Tenrec ecaudatus TaxID=94439 RepID=UPI003F5AC1BC
MTGRRTSEGNAAGLSGSTAVCVKVEGLRTGTGPRRQSPTPSSAGTSRPPPSPGACTRDTPSPKDTPKNNPLSSLPPAAQEPSMPSPAEVFSAPAPELQAGDTGRSPSPHSASRARQASLRVRNKIWEWEGKREPADPGRSADGHKSTDGHKEDLVVCGPGRRASDGLRAWVPEAQSGARLDSESTQDTGSQEPARGTGQQVAPKPGRDPPKDSLSVLRQVRKLEQALRDGSAGLNPQPPGTCYSPICLPSPLETRTLLDLGAREPSPEPARAWNQSQESMYGQYEGAPPRAFINPLPKPRRTFKHEGERGGARPPDICIRREKSLPPLPSSPPPPLPSSPPPPLPSSPPPPLPSSPPPPSVNRRLWNGRQRPSADHRKSYEFEDVLQSSTESCRVDWYAQTKLGLSRTLSEENVYEDILDPPTKENPYEDIELHGRCLGKKCALPFPGSPATGLPEAPAKALVKPAFLRHGSQRSSCKPLDTRKLTRDGTVSPSRVSPPSTPSSPDDTFFNLGDVQNGRRKRKIPKLVLRINAVYEARRGKKRVKLLSQSAESSSGKVTDENSESDSDAEEKLEAHSQRLVHVRARLKQAPRCPPLDRGLLEHQERQLFEYFVVVSLHRKQAGAAYVPELTQQFPLKLERSFKFLRAPEDQLKAIPQFCFPDAKDWTPVQEFTSETFSFVLTGEDGSRRFGYCRRLLPGGKGKRLPEVYCIVSRLGCFSLFSKILDEVEKRRGISPALVQPLMRSVMEAPFPALGKTIMIKNFLPGTGTEVIELCRPLDSRLEHVNFECLFSSLSVRHLVCVFASLLLERRVIFVADRLSTLSTCCHAVVALTYPFTWQHTFVPVLPPAMIDIVCSPTPFLIGLLGGTLPLLQELPLEEVLVVDLDNNRFLRQMDDEDSILPRKLQAALEQVLEQREELAREPEEAPADCRPGPESSPLNAVVSEAFVRFFVEIVGHYSLFLTPGEREERTLHREAFRKAVSSRSLRRFLEVFMETQTFRGFAQERALRRQDAKGLFEVRAQEYLETLPSGEHSGVNRFLKGLGNKMKFLHKK